MLTESQINIIGFMAGACTTVSFLPQIIKIFRTRRAQDISLIMYVVLVAGVVLWLVYGIAIAQYPVIIANVVTLALCLVILAAKIRYGGGR